MIWGLYPIFLDAGYSPALFWDLGIDEVEDLIESYARRQEHEFKQRKAELKDEMMVLFNQALQIGNVVGKLMDKDVSIRPLREYYPDLFQEEEEEEAEEEENIFTEAEEGDEPNHKLSLELQIHKANMDDFIFRHNMAMRMKREQQERGEGSGRNDTGKAASDHRGTD